MELDMMLYANVVYLALAVALDINICIVKQPGYGYNTEQALQNALQNLSGNSDVTSSVSIATLSTMTFSSSLPTDCSVFNMTCSGLITFADCPHSLLVDVWAESHVIPHVIFTDKSCDLVTTHGVKMIPHFTTTNMLMSDIMTQENWTDAVILNDGLFGKKECADLANRLSAKFISTTTFDLLSKKTKEESILYSLNFIEVSNFKHIVVLATDSTVREIFSQALEKDMLGQKYYWVVLSDSLTFPTLKTMLIERSNIVVVRSRDSPGIWDTCKKDSPETCLLHNETQVYAMKIQDAFQIFLQVLNRVPDGGQFKSDKCENDSALMSVRETMVKMIKQELLVGVGGKYKFNQDGYITDVMYDVTSTSDTYHTWFIEVATWSMATRLRVAAELYPNAFRSFGNRTLLIGSQQSRPHVIKNTVNNVTSFTGFCIDILDELALRLDFKYKIMEPPDGIWGAPIDNEGNWSGVVGMVMRKELSMGVGPMTITSLRESVIDFTKPYMGEGIGILTRKSGGESQKMFKMFTPFAPIVWGCIVIAMFVVVMLLYVVNRYSPYASHRQLLGSSSSASDEIMSMRSSLWLIYGSYMEQGGDPHPNSISGRCIVGFWWLFTILMASTYTANLAAFLTVTIAEKPINSLAELAGQNEIKPLVKFGSNLYSLFKEANGGIYKDIWDLMPGFPVIKNSEEALPYIEDGTVAYMTDYSQLEYIVLNECETYSLADEIFNTAGLGFVVPENSPYLEAFNYNIMKMQEAGLMDKWKLKWWPSSDKCSGSDRTSAAAILGLDSLAGPFLMYATVAGAAFLCLLLEFGLYTSKLNILCEKLKQL